MPKGEADKKQNTHISIQLEIGLRAVAIHPKAG